MKRVVAGLALLGVIAIAAMQPAMAAQHSTGHFLVSVKVVYHCEIQANVSVTTHSVTMVMRHCPGSTRPTGAGFTDVVSNLLPGAYSTRYVLSGTANHGRSGVEYVNVSF